MPALARTIVLAGLLLGTAPGAPATAGDGAWAPTLTASSAFDNLSAFADGTMYSTVGAVAFNNGDLIPSPLPRQRGDTVGFLRSTDYGQTWAPVAPPPAPATGTMNLWVRFATPKTGYATASFRYGVPKEPTGTVDKALCKRLSGTFRTTDGGVTWQPLCEPHLPDGSPVSPSPSPLAVTPDGRTVLMTGTEPAGADDNDCGISRGVVHTSHDAGETWTAGRLPRHWEPSWVVRAYDRRTALVVAYFMETQPDCGAIGRRTGVFRTDDGGRTWRLVYDCRKHPICTAAAFVTRTRMIVGTTDGATAWSNDSGRTWRLGQPLREPANREAERLDPERRYWHWVQSFDFANPNVGYASTRGAGTWRTVDGGRTWTQERSHECVYYPWGIGENAVATTDRAITGGPGLISARLPGVTPAGPCTPRDDQLPAPPAVVARTGTYAATATGLLTR